MTTNDDSTIPSPIKETLAEIDAAKAASIRECGGNDAWDKAYPTDLLRRDAILPHTTDVARYFLGAVGEGGYLTLGDSATEPEYHRGKFLADLESVMTGKGL